MRHSLLWKFTHRKFSTSREFKLMYLEEELNQCINGRSVEESKQLEKNLECVQKMVP